MGVVREKSRKLSDAYRFDGFDPEPAKVRGVFGNPNARILPLKRRSKKHDAANAAPLVEVGMIARPSSFVTCHVETRMSTWKLNSGAWTAGRAAR